MNPTEARNIASVRQQVVWLNEHDIHGFVSDLADDFVWRSDVLPEETVGKEGAREGLAEIYAVFPDIQFQELALYPSGETVVGVFDVSGTEIGARADSLLPPLRNHPWHVNQAIIHTFDSEGKMKLVWLFTNVAYLLQQIGVLPQDLTTFGAPEGLDFLQRTSGGSRSKAPPAPDFLDSPINVSGPWRPSEPPMPLSTASTGARPHGLINLSLAAIQRFLLLLESLLPGAAPPGPPLGQRALEPCLSCRQPTHGFDSNGGWR